MGSTSTNYKLSRSLRLPCSLKLEGGEVYHHYGNNLYATHWNWRAEQINVCRLQTPSVLIRHPPDQSAISAAPPFQKAVISFQKGAVSEGTTSSSRFKLLQRLAPLFMTAAHFLCPLTLTVSNNACGFQHEWRKLVIHSCFEGPDSLGLAVLVDRPLRVIHFNWKLKELSLVFL